VGDARLQNQRLENLQPGHGVILRFSCRAQQIEVTHAKCEREFVHRDHRRIPVAALQAADVLLTEPRTPLSTVPDGIMSQRFRNVHHHCF
jgi:hypothetical protein